jgi:hypothetical protein
MATAAEIQAQINDANNRLAEIAKAGNSLGTAAERSNLTSLVAKLKPQLTAAQKAEASTPISQVAPQAAAPKEEAQPAKKTTPVAPASNAGGYQLPTLNQSIIDKQFKYGIDRSNELTIGNSDIRDQIYNAGWKEKSDAVRVLTGAGNYGIVSNIEGMGGSAFKNLQGGVASDDDFINAAKAAGIENPSQYQKSAGGGLGSIGSKVLDQNKIFSLLQEKGKDLYTVTNAVEGAERGDTAKHATATYKTDGSGNLVPVTNAATGQPDVKYFDAVRYKEAPGFMDEYGPFLMLAPAFGGILQSAGVIPTFGSAAGTAGSGSGAFPAGAGGYGSVGPAGFTASTAAPTLAGVASSIPTPPISSGGVSNVANGGGYNVAGGAASAAGGAALPASNVAASGAGSLLGNVGGTAAGGTLANALNTGALVSGIGAGAGALASYTGSQLQADAAKEAARNQMLMFNTINQQFAPQRGAGYQSLNQIRSMLPGQSMTYNELGQPSGVQTGTDYLTRQFTPQDLQSGLAPNYQFMLGQGQQAQQRAANVGGGLIGGNALRGLEQYTQDYAGNAYQNAFGNFQNQRTGIYNTLAGIAGLGQQAQNTTAQAGQAATTAQGQLGVGSAAAQAAGLTGASNALAGGLQNYQQNQILQAVLGQNQNVAQQTPGYFG